MTEITLQYLEVNNLSESQKLSYNNAISASYPEFILNSKVIKNYWERLESYFPKYQIAMLDLSDNLIGFMNSIPFYWGQPLIDLSDDGWDWQMKKGVDDFERGVQPNHLGGIQIIILKEYQGKGFSKLMIAKGKDLMEESNFENFVLPIRPTFKWKHPEVRMIDYIEKLHNGETYDPWIRTHLKSGAEIIKVCSNAMNISGDISFWENMLDFEIKKNQSIVVEGALSPIVIDVKKNFGEYREENIWIYYANHKLKND